jgi:hypothetical protein
VAGLLGCRVGIRPNAAGIDDLFGVTVDQQPAPFRPPSKRNAVEFDGMKPEFNECLWHIARKMVKDRDFVGLSGGRGNNSL